MASKNYLITGTSRGIGLEMCNQLVKTGHRVFAMARDPEGSAGLQSLRKQANGLLNVFTLDVDQQEQVASVALELRGTIIDVLINNAGKGGSSRDFESLSLEEVQNTIATNALGAMRVTRAFLPHLRQSAQPKLIHITSLMGSIADNESGGYYGYRMSKAALNMFNKSFAIDYPEVISLVVHPGWVKTDMGGPQAPLPPEIAVRGILSVVNRATTKQTGKFFDYEGNELPW